MLFLLPQARLAALTSPDEIAFLQRTFDLSTSSDRSRRVKAELTAAKFSCPSSPADSISPTEIVPSLAKTSSTGSLNGYRTKPTQSSSPAISKKPSVRQLSDQQKRPNQAATRLCAPAALSRTDSGYSLTSTKKPKHVAASLNNNHGLETPNRGNNVAETATFSSNEVNLDKPDGSTNQLVPAVGISKGLSQIRTSPSNSSVNSSIDGNLAPVSRSLCATGRQRPPLVSSRPVSSRYAQTTIASASSSSSVDAPSTLKSASDVNTTTTRKTLKIHHKKSAGIIESTPVQTTMTADKVIPKVPKKQLSAVPSENILLASTWASDSTANSKVSNASSLQLQRQGPKTPRQPVLAGLSSPASVKSVTKNPTKKVEIGKLFGLVGFNKVDTALPGNVLPHNTTPTARPNSSRNNFCAAPPSLDQNMKDALQREANARAALQAAEIAAESARFAASAAHAEAVAAARAIVREAEIEQSRNVYTGDQMILAPPPVIAALYTQSSMILDVNSAAEKELWTNPGTAIDGLSPKRKAENPFKGMF